MVKINNFRQGLAKNISWTNIRVYNVTFPIFVTQTYYNQGNTQTQNGNGATTGRPNNATVNMEDFTWANWTGTINQFKPGDGSCASDVGLPFPIWNTTSPLLLSSLSSSQRRPPCSHSDRSPAGITSVFPTSRTPSPSSSNATRISRARTSSFPISRSIRRAWRCLASSV